MRILGIDPGLKITGYGVIDFKERSCVIVEAGIISTESRQPLPERLQKIYLCLLDLINELKPETVVLEKLYAHYRHPATAFLLGHARGVISLACAQKKIILVEYSATRVKKAILGRGHASKDQIQRMVMHLLSLKTLPKYTDVTDALALALCHTHILRT